MQTIKFSVYEHAAYENERIPELISRYQGMLSLKVVAKPYFLYQMRKGMAASVEEMLVRSREILEDMQCLVKNLYTKTNL